LARLHAVAQRVAADEAWQAGMPPFKQPRLAEGIPLLHGQTLAVDTARLRGLAVELAALVAEARPDVGEPVHRAFVADGLHPLNVLGAVVRHDDAALSTLASAVGADNGVLAT